MKFEKTYSTDVKIIGQRYLTEPEGEAKVNDALLIEVLIDDKHKISIETYDVMDLSTYCDIYDDEMSVIDITSLGTNVFESNKEFFREIHELIISYILENGIPREVMGVSEDSYMINQIVDNLEEGLKSGILYEYDEQLKTEYELNDETLTMRNNILTGVYPYNGFYENLCSAVIQFSKTFNEMIMYNYCWRDELYRRASMRMNYMYDESSKLVNHHAISLPIIPQEMIKSSKHLMEDDINIQVDQSIFPHMINPSVIEKHIKNNVIKQRQKNKQ